MGLVPYTYAAPESEEEAVKAITQEENALYLAGGTDLVPLMKQGLREPTCVISLGKIKSMKRIEETPEGIFIGAMVTLTELAENSLVCKHLKPLARAAGWVASPQIRNMGTLGGNILQERRCFYFNQSRFWRESVPPCYKLGGDLCYQIPKAKSCRAIYYSDLATILLAYKGRVQVFDREGFRERPLEALIGESVATHSQGHLVTGFIVPREGMGLPGRFLKYSVRGSIDFALSNVGMVYSGKQDSHGGPLFRIFAGAVSPEPVRLAKTEAMVLGLLPHVLSRREEIIQGGISELESLSSLIRETAVTPKAKRGAMLIIADALRDFLPVIAAG